MMFLLQSIVGPLKRPAQGNVFQSPKDVVPGIRISKKGRRESASAVDEFFNTGSSSLLNLSVNMNIALVRNTDNATPVHNAHLNSRTQTRTDIVAPVRSDGIIEELFGPIPSMVAEMSSWPIDNTASSPCANGKASLPDMSSLSFNMQPISKPVDNFGCIPLSRQISDSLWEDLSQTIDSDAVVEIDPESSNRTSKTTGSETSSLYPTSALSPLLDNDYMSCSLNNCAPGDLVAVKAEPMDNPASCTFQTLQRTDVASLQAINVKLESAAFNNGCLATMAMNTTSSMSTHAISRPKFLPITPQTPVGSRNLGLPQQLTPLKAAIASTLTPATPTTYTMFTQGGMVQNNSLPPTPPHSQPNSPNDDGRRHTPPPPYTADRQATLPDSGVLVPLTPVTHRPRLTHPGCTTIKYNRRNNPDLEKRRIHFCDFPGKLSATVVFPFVILHLKYYLAI